MKKSTPLFFIVLCLFIYQNCGGGFSASSDGSNAGVVFAPAEELDITNLELKRYTDNTGEFFQTVRVNVTSDSMFIIVDESEICQRSFELGKFEQQQMYSLLRSLSYSNKGSTFPTENNLVTEFTVEMKDGEIRQGNVLESDTDINSVGIDQDIIDQSAQLVALLDEMMAKEYSVDQSACLSQNVIPQHVRYIWTDVQGNSSVVREAFLFESQNNGNVVFLSEATGTQGCFQAYLLNLHEQAIALRALSNVVLNTNTEDLTNAQGLRFINYTFPGDDTVNTYYIDQAMAPANSQLLNNGERITDVVLGVLAMARERYQTIGETHAALEGEGAGI
ncbi:MAG: hypothetical protein HRT44_00990, partial [Bdellovibrionales bacterium]|nr:hypothetical protein [Bdellovibrionales bacterium]NQZ17826.1 hypothetical protein [Bdellovibrionales bacterium]